MPALTSAIGGFRTGDLVITYLPGADKRPLHLTVFLSPGDSPSGQAAFVHAGNSGVIIEGSAGYAEMPKYRHARRTGALGAAAAQAAKVWAADRTIPNAAAPITTPYGSYPGGAQSLTPGMRANRFSAMKGTPNLAAIPIEAAGVVRLMKWTYRFIANAPLSKNRGITCAAFTCACHQAAAMHLFLRDAGVLSKFDQAAMGKINALLESKADLRARIPLPEATPNPGVTLPKPILIGGALRDNSNRGMTPATKTAVNNISGKVGNAATSKGVADQLPQFFPDDASLATATEADYIWLFIQTKILGISSYNAARLADVIPPDFYYDAKYVNSLLLNQLILQSGVLWQTADFDTY
jgi:hypothetical protein